MNLRNNRITVAEVLSNQNARMLLAREYPMLLRNPMLVRMRNVPLGQVIQYAGRMIPPYRLQALLEELENC